MNDEETHETGGVSARVSASARDSRERNQGSNRNFLFKFVSIFGVGSRTIRHLRPTHRSGASENDEKAIKYSWNVLATTARRKICFTATQKVHNAINCGMACLGYFSSYQNCGNFAFLPRKGRAFDGKRRLFLSELRTYFHAHEITR